MPKFLWDLLLSLHPCEPWSFSLSPPCNLLLHHRHALLNLGLHCKYCRGISNNFQLYIICLSQVSLACNVEFVFCIGIAYRYFGKKPVYLSLWQWVCSFIFYGVLRSYDHKWSRQLICNILYSYLPLLHRLKQGRLGSRRGPVYFVCQNHVAKYWTFSEYKLRLVSVKDKGSCYICWQQV